MLPTFFNRRQRNHSSIYVLLIMLVSLLNTFRYLGSARVQVSSIRLCSIGKTAVRSITSRYYTDREYRRQQLTKRVEAYRQRKAQDPAYHERCRAASAEAYRKRKSCERRYRWKLFGDWLRSGWHTADLPWKTYRAEVFSEGVERACAGCQLLDHKTKFWWTSVSDVENHLCGRCASKLSWEEVCPKGFEDAATLREFTARAKELGLDQSSKSKL